MIKILDSFIADKIAAGEVIERPLSIVKELVENSIDAGATNIIVEIRNGGKSYIRITDNGSGIPAGEVELAFERHATGKIQKLEDLDHIGTLGFRGEALASICAISRLTIFTKTVDENTGVRLEMHGGKIVNREQTGANNGTTMIIEDVFYNTPARRKFMRSDASEASAIIDLIQKLAIYYSSVAFKMINNGKTVLTTSGDGNTLHAVTRIYPSRDFRNLIEIQGEYVHGYISDPGTTRTNRTGQIFFVNGRYIKSNVLEKGLMNGYGSRIFSGYPIAILFVQVAPETIDVNIHPSKKEVKFLDAKEIEADLSQAVQNVILSENTIPDADYRSRLAPETKAAPAKKPETSEQLGIRDFLSRKERPQKTVPAAEPAHKSNTEMLYDSHRDISKQYTAKPSVSTVSEPAVKPVKTTASEAPLREKLASMPERKPAARPELKPVRKEEVPVSTPAKPIPKASPMPLKPAPTEVPTAAPATKPASAPVIEEPVAPAAPETPVAAPATIDIRPPKIRQFRFEDLKVRGYVFSAYIITQIGDNLYILDQHAAHERIMYEKLVGQYNREQHPPQPILTPIMLYTSSDIYYGERNWMEVLRKVGYEIEDFGANTFIIKGIPAYMSVSEADTFAKNIMNSPENPSEQNSTVIDKLIMRSCKAAVKANDMLSDKEIQDLLDQLSQCVNPFSCPHGRPTFIRITKYEVERAFKRK